MRMTMILLRARRRGRSPLGGTRHRSRIRRGPILLGVRPRAQPEDLSSSRRKRIETGVDAGTRSRRGPGADAGGDIGQHPETQSLAVSLRVGPGLRRRERDRPAKTSHEGGPSFARQSLARRLGGRGGPVGHRPTTKALPERRRESTLPGNQAGALRIRGRRTLSALRRGGVARPGIRRQLVNQRPYRGKETGLRRRYRHLARQRSTPTRIGGPPVRTRVGARASLARIGTGRGVHLRSAQVPTIGLVRHRRSSRKAKVGAPDPGKARRRGQPHRRRLREPPRRQLASQRPLRWRSRAGLPRSSLRRPSGSAGWITSGRRIATWRSSA